MPLRVNLDGAQATKSGATAEPKPGQEREPDEDEQRDPQHRAARSRRRGWAHQDREGFALVGRQSLTFGEHRRHHGLLDAPDPGIRSLRGNDRQQQQAPWQLRAVRQATSLGMRITRVRPDAVDSRSLSSRLGSVTCKTSLSSFFPRTLMAPERSQVSQPPPSQAAHFRLRGSSISISAPCSSQSRPATRMR